MNRKHLTEEEIQEYALQENKSSAALTLHLETCEECRDRIKEYTQLFSSLQEQPREVFGFDLADLVLQQLPVPVHRTSPEKGLAYSLVAISIAIVALVIYVFREYAAGFFTSIAPFFLYLLTTAFVCISAWLIADMYKKYKNKLRDLNLYNA